MIGGWVARIVPSSGIVTLRVGEQLEQEGLEVVVGAVDLVDQQYRRARARVLERPQQRSADQVVGAEQLLLVERAPARLGEPDAEQLARIVPLVERLGRVDPLVALQPDQRHVERRGQRHRRRGLADPRLPLEQQRLRQPQAEEDRGRQALVDEIVDCGEPLGERLDVGTIRSISAAASPVTGSRDRSSRRQLLEDRPVVLGRVDVTWDRARDRHLDDLVGPLVEEPPHALVAVQVCERRERPRPRRRSDGPCRPRSGRRRAAPRRGRRAAPRPSRCSTPGWSPSISTSTSQRGSTSAERRRDRGRAARRRRPR